MTASATHRGRWSDHLVKAIAQQNFLCVIGSGVSAASTNTVGAHPPTWKDLLEHLTVDLVPVEAHRKKIRALAKSHHYLAAAELLRHYADQAGRIQDLYGGIVDRVESPGDTFRPNPWHDEILRLDPLVLVTTNFDRILERATDTGFGVHLPDSEDIDVNVRSGTPIIIKMHGSVDRREGIVLCQSDFARMRQRSGHMLSILHALLLTRSCLFIGYSLDDPDMRLILENVLGARSVRPAHFLLTPQSPSPYRKSLFESAYGVTLVEYKKDDHQDGLSTLQALGDLVEEKRAATVVV